MNEKKQILQFIESKDLNKDLLILFILYIGNQTLVYAPYFQNLKLLARWLELINFDSDKIGEEWNILRMAIYTLHPSCCAPDMCATCLTYHGFIIGGNVRYGCPNCQPNDKIFFECGWPSRLREILNLTEPCYIFHMACALYIHKQANLLKENADAKV